MEKQKEKQQGVVKRRKRRSPEQWRALIEDHSTSGQSIELYCEAHDIAPSGFYARRRELTKTKVSGKFVEMKNPSNHQKQNKFALKLCVEIELGDGRCLRVYQ